MQVRHHAGEQAVDSRAESVAGARVHGQLVACASDRVDIRMCIIGTDHGAVRMDCVASHAARSICGGDAHVLIF